MSYYYLIASLPLLSLDQDIPFTPDQFVSASQHLLSERDRQDMLHILEGHPERCNDTGVQEYVQRDIQLQNAIVRHRARKRSIEAHPFLKDFTGYDVYIENSIARIMTMDNPLEREIAIDRLRWEILDSCTSREPFGVSLLFAFLIKLKIALRWTLLKEETGVDKLDELIQTNLQEGLVE